MLLLLLLLMELLQVLLVLQTLWIKPMMLLELALLPNAGAWAWLHPVMLSLVWLLELLTQAVTRAPSPDNGPCGVLNGEAFNSVTK